MRHPSDPFVCMYNPHVDNINTDIDGCDIERQKSGDSDISSSFIDYVIT